MRKDEVLERLRAICRRLPEVIETTTFGHPTFQAGKKKTFVVLDDHEREPPQPHARPPGQADGETGQRQQSHTEAGV